MRQPADAYEYKPAIKKWVQKQPKLIYNTKQEFRLLIRDGSIQ